MKRIVLAAALAAPFALPAAASAQAIPAAKIAVVNAQKIFAECKACKVGQAALASQGKGLEALQKSLGTPLQTEQASLQKEIAALGGQEPSAALKAKAEAFAKKNQEAQVKVQTRAQQLERNRAYVTQQISVKMGEAVNTVMKRRGANIALEMNTALSNDDSLEITTDVMTELDRILPSVNTTAPAPKPAAAAPAKK